MSEDGKRTLLFEMADALMRSWWTVVAGLCVGMAGAILALHYVPKMYEATTKIRVAPAAIPEELLKTTVTEDMSRVLMEVKEAILGREYMLALIDRTFGTPETESEIQGLIRRIQSSVEVRTAQQAGLFALTYQDSDPDRAADVVNTLTRIYVEGNADFRRDSAESTRETFERLATEAQREFELVDAELREFRARHFLRTEGTLTTNAAMLSQRQQELSRIEGERASLLHDLQDLEAQFQRQRANPRATDPLASAIDPDAARLAQARRELDSLLARYSDAHPAVIAKQYEVAELERNYTPRPAAGSGEIDPLRSPLEDRIASTRRRLGQLDAQRGQLQGELGRIESRIETTGSVQVELNALEERHRVLDERYKEYKTKSEAARGSEFLEKSGRGQRLDVIEWAVVPFKPVFPDPFQVKVLGVGLGLLLFVGPLLLGRYLNPVVSSESGLRAITDVPVLVSIPRIPTPANHGSERRLLAKNMSIAVACTLMLAAILVVWR